MPPELTAPDPPHDEAHWRRMMYTMWLAMFFVFLEWTLGSAFVIFFGWSTMWPIMTLLDRV